MNKIRYQRTYVFYFFILISYFYAEHAEADCFFTFTKLMSEIRDFFIKSLDEAESGIGHLMTRLANEVKALDSSIYSYLKEIQLLPQYYSFR